MLIRTFFNRETGIIRKVVFLKRKNGRIVYEYELCSPYWLGDTLYIYSVKTQTLKNNFLEKHGRNSIIKKKTYRCYQKQFGIAQEGDWK